MKVGYIVIRQLLLVDNKQKRAKTQLRKPVKREKLARKQTYRWNWALDAIPSSERSHGCLLWLLNTFRTRGAVFLGLAWLGIASHSQKTRDGWKKLAREQIPRWNWDLDFISSPECSYGCLLWLLNTFSIVRATAAPFFELPVFSEHYFHCLAAWWARK